MKCRSRLAPLLAVAALLAGGDLLACGDKYLVASRGTRYHRPKNARAASVVIYAHPSSDPAAGGRVESMLKRQGHHIKTATTLEQLSTILSGGRFDVVLAASDMAAKIQQLIGESAGGAVVVAFDARPSAATLLKAVDSAVVQHDQTLRRNRTGS